MYPVLLIKRLNFLILIIKIIVFDLNIDSFMIVLRFSIMILSINERHLTSLTSFSPFGIQGQVWWELVKWLQLTVLTVISIDRLYSLIFETSLIYWGIGNTFKLNIILIVIVIDEVSLKEVTILFDMNLFCNFFFHFLLRMVINLLQQIQIQFHLIIKMLLTHLCIFEFCKLLL